MDLFQCWKCELNSSDEAGMKRHMNVVHNTKVEVNTMNRKFCCPQCPFGSRDMGEYKNHLVSEHEKEKHNWMVEDLKAVFSCDECTLEFSEISMLSSHMDNHHSEDGMESKDSKVVNTANVKDKPQNKFVSSVVKIIPDNSFLTKNTADLKLMLETIPIEALEYDEDAFEMDFKLVLNSGEKQTQTDSMESFKCEECNFRASTRRCLSTHKAFVHNAKYYKCEQCPNKTRTEEALKYHMDLKHNQFLKTEKESLPIMKGQN